jgi:hypothetical protein
MHDWQPPWPPIQIAECEWIILRNHWKRPAAIVRRIEGDNGCPAHFRVVSWAPTSADRKLLGRYLTLEAADRSVLFDVDLSSGPGKSPEGMWHSHSLSAEGMRGDR